jgi:manganese/iron transport system permease protein
MFVKVDTDQHLNHVLFGNVLGVTWRDVAEAALIALPTIAIILVKRRDFLVYCFDPGHARALGLPVRGLQIALLTLLALTIVASLKAVGVILVIAMLIAPGAIGFVATRRFGRMMAIAVAAATGSCVVGTYASYYLDAATGPMIVVVQACTFALVLVIRGLAVRTISDVGASDSRRKTA